MTRTIWAARFALLATLMAGCGGKDDDNTVGRGNTAAGQWPVEEVTLFGPGTDSGTFDYFTKAIVGEEKASRADYTASEDDNQLVTGVKNDRYALAYFGYAYYEENKDSLKLLGVENGSGTCVQPSLETVRSNAYAPLSRPLFIYVSKKSLARPDVAKFLKFYLANAAELAKDVGYVPVSDEVDAENHKKLDEAIASADSPGRGEGVRIDGSSTVFPISEAVAEEFRNEAPDIKVTVGYSGTGGGLKKFSAGEIDICDASRGIKDSEKQACEDAGIDFIELSVAFDGLAVVVHPENDWCDCLTVEQLKELWKPDSKITTWADLKAVGTPPADQSAEPTTEPVSADGEPMDPPPAGGESTKPAAQDEGE